MIIRVKVQLGSKLESVRKLPDGRFLVLSSADRKNGEANAAVSALLAVYFHVPQSQIVLVSGHTQSTKTFRVYGGGE